MAGLSGEHQRAVLQLREIINGADDEVAVDVLSSVDWDVQRAAELIFGAGSSSNVTSTSSNHEIESFEVDDSEQGELGPFIDRGGRPRRTPYYSLTMFRPLLSILAIPLHILSGVFRFIFGVLRIPFPQFRFMSLNFHRPLGSRPTSRRGPDRWLRDLEEETGAISIGRLKLPRGTTSSVNVDPGRSSLSSRVGNVTGQSEDGRKLLPDFTVSTYEDMLKTCQRDVKIGCVILVSDEHDDVPEFKRSTLTDSTFVKMLYDNDIVVWGGDVRDGEAWSASEKLQATTYPFVAFLALQPRRSPVSSAASRTTTPPTLTVLSRHQGKSTPSSGPTSAQTLVEHLERQLLPRVTPFLNRILSVQRQHERDRHLREEQDRAFQTAAMRDKERIEARMAEERALLESTRMAEEEARLAAQRRAREAEIARQKESNRMEWRRWTRGAVVGSPNATNVRGALRVAIRLPNGGRVVHQFSPDATLTSLYAFVDTQFIPANLGPSSDPSSLPDLTGRGEQGLEAHIVQLGQPSEYWGFHVVLAYPRIEIPWKSGTQLSTIEHLKGGGQVVVEMLNNTHRSAQSQATVNGEEDDGYRTEDSE